jgi:hypothetical protein
MANSAAFTKLDDNGRTMERSLNLQRVREHGAHIGPRDLRAPAEIKVPHPWFGVDDVGDVLNLPLAAKGVVGVRSDVLFDKFASEFDEQLPGDNRIVGSSVGLLNATRTALSMVALSPLRSRMSPSGKSKMMLEVLIAFSTSNVSALKTPDNSRSSPSSPANSQVRV